MSEASSDSEIYEKLDENTVHNEEHIEPGNFETVNENPADDDDDDILPAEDDNENVDPNTQTTGDFRQKNSILSSFKVTIAIIEIIIVIIMLSLFLGKRFRAPVDRLTQLPLSRIKAMIKNFDPEWKGQSSDAAVLMCLVCSKKFVQKL